MNTICPRALWTTLKIMDAADIFGAVDAFLHAKTTNQVDIEQLRLYLQHRPEMAPVHEPLPADEMDERLQFAMQASGWIGDENDPIEGLLTNFGMSVIFCMPLDELRYFATHHDNSKYFASFAGASRRLVQSCKSHDGIREELSVS